MRPGSEMAAGLELPPFAPGTVWLAGAGPGDPGLLTLLARHALEQADVVLHDALVADPILALAGPRARLEPVGKRAGQGGARQMVINERLIAHARAGLRVLRLKGGDPFVFGRGSEEALALAAAGVHFRIVPGVTAASGAAALAGIPLTHRGSAQAVTLVTGHGAGGEVPRGVDWASIAKASPVIVLYMALRRIGTIAAELIAAGRDPGEPVALISEGTTETQQTVIATLATAAEAAARVPVELPTLIVIGPTVALHEVLAAWQETAPARPTAAAEARTPTIHALG